MYLSFLHFVSPHDFFEAASTVDSVAIISLGLLLGTGVSIVLTGIVIAFFDGDGEVGTLLGIAFIGFIAAALGFWGFSHQAQVIYSKMDGDIQIVENNRGKNEYREFSLEKKDLKEEDKYQRFSIEEKSLGEEESFLYASDELNKFVDALGGRAIGCSNYQAKGDFLPCTLVTDKDEILEVGCPSKKGMHGCLLTDNAYSVLRTKGFNLTIDNDNVNSNNNTQKSK